MLNPFIRMVTDTAEQLVINVNQIVLMKKCTNHPAKPGEQALLTEVRLTAGDCIYVPETIEELYDRIENL